MRAAPSRRAALGLALVLGSVVLGAPSPGVALGAQTAAAQRRALLVRGADAIKGLPFFPPNAIRALAGSYSPDSAVGGVARGSASSAANGSEFLVWYTRESLVMSGAWKRAGIGEAQSYTLADRQLRYIIIKEPTYFLCFGIAAGSGAAKTDAGAGTGALDAATAAFIRAFEQKFRAFHDNAASDAELSFPAFVDY